ncbi:response regulator transcription factor [Paenibacillus plantarum]|nr:response regulator [Paenibacillus plantarum]
MYSYIIVDDEPLIRRGMLKKLQAFDQDITFAGEADNGIDAIELIKQANPDIIFTDMRMPEMDGKSFLRVLQLDFPEKKIIVVSGYTDFEYMQEAISAKVVGYLLKPFSREEIHDTLRKAIALIDQEHANQQKFETTEAENEGVKYHSDLQTLSNIALGFYSKNKAPELISDISNRLLNAQSFFVVTAYASDKSHHELAGRFLTQNCRSCLYLKHAHNEQLSLLLFYFSQDEDTHIVAQLASTYFQASGANITQDLFIGISQAQTTLIELHQAYEQSISALNDRPIHDTSHIYSFYDQHSELAVPDWEKTDELLFHVEAGNIQKVEELLSEYFTFLTEIPLITLSSIKRCSQKLIQEVRWVLSEYFDSIMKNSSSASFDSVMEASFEIDTIRSYFLHVLPNIAEIFKEKKIYGSQNLIDNVKTYIQKNYRKELTLEKISSLFFINPSYCSYLFKEKTGENFIDYVNSVRIDNAKLMLKNSEEKVYKIAKSLGFNNPKYFFRVFKKLTGRTPEEYRMM